MSEHKPTDVKGYRSFDQHTVDTINKVKDMEKQVGALWQELAQSPLHDPRHLAVAKTQMEDAFSRLVRAIAQPEDVYGSQPRRS
jgi:hypothetical protein